MIEAWLDYWKDAFSFQTLWSRGRILSQASGLRRIPLDTLPTVLAALAPDQVLIPYVWRTSDAQEYISPLWILPSKRLWTPFGSAAHGDWQKALLAPSPDLREEAGEWITKLGWSEDLNTAESFALLISLPAYRDSFPLLKRFWGALSAENPRVQDYMRVHAEPQPMLSRQDINDPDNIKAILSAVPEGESRALRTPIGSYASIFLLSWMQELWIERKKILYVDVQNHSYEHLLGHIDRCWDPLNQWVLPAVRRPERSGQETLSFQERVFYCLKRAQSSDLMSAQQKLLALSAELSLKMKQGEKKSISAAWKERRVGYQRRLIAANHRIDHWNSALFEYHSHWGMHDLLSEQSQTLMQSVWHSLSAQRKKKTAQALSDFKKRYNIPAALGLAQLQDYLRAERKKAQEQKRRIQKDKRACKLVYRMLQEGGLSCFYPIEFFLAQWHLQEVQHLLKEEPEAMRPLFYRLDPQALLDPQVHYPLSNVHWVLIEKAPSYTLMEGALWAVMGKKALFLGDDASYGSHPHTESQWDFYRLLERGLVHNELDFEECEWDALICSRAHSWQRVWMKQSLSLSLKNRMRRDNHLLRFIQQITQSIDPGCTTEQQPVYAGLRLMHYPGRMEQGPEGVSNPLQASYILRLLQSLRQGAVYHQAHIAVLTPFKAQEAALRSVYQHAKEDYGDIQILGPEKLCGQVYDWIVLSLVLTKEAPRPLYYDQHLSFWRSLCLSARYGVWVIGDEALFDGRLQSATGKLAHILRKLELEVV